jgi:hypothetical protein
VTNDDGCNCDKSNERLILPELDFSGYDQLSLEFDVYYLDNNYQGAQENAQVQISTDGNNWTTLMDLEGEGDWVTRGVDLSDYGNEPSVLIAFYYDDDGGWVFGFGVDNISIKEPSLLDAKLSEINKRPYGETDEVFPISGEIVNEGISEIISLEIAYSIDGGTPESVMLDNLSISAFGTESFKLEEGWTPDTPGDYTVSVEIVSVNGETDGDPSNNIGTFDTEIFEKVIRPNLIDDLLAAEPIATLVADDSDGLDKPTDLDFFPILGRDELWITNERNENIGGSTLTISDASDETPSDYWLRVDGNAWHFMSLPTSIAFSPENFNFATGAGVQDANHNGGSFTGPTLWSSDPVIYAQPSGGNGSHIDMLHGSPFSMGIAHEVDNVFWLYDDFNRDIVRYDFVDDHGPGNDDHSDGILRRYRDLDIESLSSLPNHMELDKTTGWMYIVDNGNQRVLRLDINSGEVAGPLPLINEPLAEHSEMGGYVFEEIIDEGLDQACGLEIIDNRLLIGDYATGEIIVYDMDNDFTEIGRIAASPGITGLKVGPDGSLWYTNRTENTLVKLQAGATTSSSDPAFSMNVHVSPNPTAGELNIHMSDFEGPAQYTLTDLTGKQILNRQNVVGSQQFSLYDLPNGVYLMTIETEYETMTEKIVLKR